MVRPGTVRGHRNLCRPHRRRLFRVRLRVRALVCRPHRRRLFRVRLREPGDPERTHEHEIRLLVRDFVRLAIQGVGPFGVHVIVLGDIRQVLHRRLSGQARAGKRTGTLETNGYGLLVDDGVVVVVVVVAFGVIALAGAVVAFVVAAVTAVVATATATVFFLVWLL